MLKNINYKQKLQLTGLIGLLALIVCYRLAISRTIEEYKKFTSVSGTTVGAPGNFNSLQEMRSKEATVNAIFSQYTLDTLQPDKNLLSVSSNYCKSRGLQLKEYKPYHFSKNDSIQVLTRTVTVQGSFIHCLNLLYEMEIAKKIGKVRTAEFRSYTDPLDKVVKLDCIFYVQNLIPYNHENH
jgi:hypothetical protein